MKLTIVYDNDVYRKDMGLKSDWGFSCLIESGDESILFDTGAKGEILISNMDKLGVEKEKISKIIISHEHWDHSGGLKALAPLLGDVELYRLGREKPSENVNLIIVKAPQKISEGIYTTGRLKGIPVDEQSLVLKGKKGWYVLVGCSHPGVEEILNSAKQFGNIIGLIGGLHGFNNFNILKQLDFVCAAHCTKYKKEINELLHNVSVQGGVGKTIEI